MRRSPRFLLAPLLSLLILAPGGCGSGSSGGDPTPPPTPTDGCVTGTGPEVAVTGSVLYERLVLSATGLGPALEWRPARFVDVQVRLTGGGTCYGQGSTDASGAFALLARPPSGASLEVWAFSRTNNDPLRKVTVHNALPPTFNAHTDANVFSGTSSAFTAGSPAPVTLQVPYNPGTSSRPSMGFGSLDVLLTCSESIRVATGIVPDTCHAYTRLGNSGATGTSFYSHAARALTLLGGASGMLDTSDTDYFDDAVIAHEYGHFIEYLLAHTLTRGGSHGGEDLEPNFSWSEGQATGFGCLQRGTPAYIDTTGTSGGGILISNSAETWARSQPVRGIGGEETVAELVWDLGDGGGGPTDADGDVATLPLGQILGAFFGFTPATDAPYIGLLLDRLEQAGSISSGDLSTLLAAPDNQQITYPLAGDDVWPVPLPVPGVVTGACNSMTGNHCRGIQASTWYGFTLASSATLTFALDVGTIVGSGDDLDLYLLRAAGSTVASSTGAGSVDEQIGPITLAAGVYLVRVEADCAGFGNEASYSLTVTP